jgi:hypothetical protein
MMAVYFLLVSIVIGGGESHLIGFGLTTGTGEGTGAGDGVGVGVVIAAGAGSEVCSSDPPHDTAKRAIRINTITARQSVLIVTVFPPSLDFQLAFSRF